MPYTEKLYSVKEVMQLCSITRKQLYIYEEKGLVLPQRNRDNRYRLYTEDQLIRIELIKECRSLGFNFESIGEMLTDMNPRSLWLSIQQAMADAREKLDKSIRQYESSMARYTSIIEATTLLGGEQPEVKREKIEGQNTICYEFKGNFFDDIMTFYTEYANLERLIKDGGYTKISGKRECFTRVFDEQYDINTGEQVISLSYQIKEDASDDPHFKKIEPFEALTLIHIGSYTDPLITSYRKITDYAAAAGIMLSAVSYEEHIIEPAFAYNNSDMWVTKITIPTA